MCAAGSFKHLVDTSSIMAAGTTVVTNGHLESLVVPKSTGFVTSAIIGEGSSITESDSPWHGDIEELQCANFIEITPEPLGLSIGFLPGRGNPKPRPHPRQSHQRHPRPRHRRPPTPPPYPDARFAAVWAAQTLSLPRLSGRVRKFFGGAQAALW
jgi:hypothetical protein